MSSSRSTAFLTAGLVPQFVKRLGRPRRIVDAARVASLRAHGLGLRAIAEQLVGVGTLYRVAPPRSKIQERDLGTGRPCLGD